MTRAPHQASELADKLRAVGAEPILIPTIEIAPPKSYAALDAALLQLASFDLVAFTSANAVAAFAGRAKHLNIAPAPQRIAAVGPSTATALEAIGLHAEIVPPAFTAEALAEVLCPDANGRHILLLLPENGLTRLRDALVASGAEVTVAIAYRNIVPSESPAMVKTLFSDLARNPDAVTFTSSSTAIHLAALLAMAGVTMPESVVLASIGPVTSESLRNLGLPPHVEAQQSTIASLVDALAAQFSAHG